MVRVIVFLMAVLTVVSVFFTQPQSNNQIVQRAVNEILQNNQEADIFMLNNKIYYRGDHFNWVRKMDSMGILIEPAGTIRNEYQPGMKFENGMATKLPIGSIILYGMGVSPKPFVVIKDQFSPRTNVYVLLDKLYETNLVTNSQLP